MPYLLEYSRWGMGYIGCRCLTCCWASRTWGSYWWLRFSWWRWLDRLTPCNQLGAWCAYPWFLRRFRPVACTLGCLPTWILLWDKWWLYENYRPRLIYRDNYAHFSYYKSSLKMSKTTYDLLHSSYLHMSFTCFYSFIYSDGRTFVKRWVRCSCVSQHSI